MKKIVCICLFGLLSMTGMTQSVGVGTLTPNSSSLLDIQSTTKGILIPRMTTAQRDAIVSPASGLQILNLDDYCLDIYDGDGWIKNCGLRMTGTDTAFASVEQVANFGGSARYEAVGFSIDTKGYVGTGWDGAHKKDFWEYNPATNAWTQKADFGGIARRGAVGFVTQGKGYIGTGHDGTSTRKDFWAYNPVTNSWTQRADYPNNSRYHAVAFTNGMWGYVGLGQNYNNTLVYDEMYEYNPVNNSWTSKNSCPVPGHSMVAFGLPSGCFLGIGIIDIPIFGEQETSGLWHFNPAGSGTWTSIANFPGGARINAVGLVIDGKGYVATGKTGTSTYFKDVWEFSGYPDLIWERKPDISTTGRTYATGFSIDGVGYIGTGFDGAAKADFYAFEPYPIGPVYENTLDVDGSGGFNDGIWNKMTDQIATNHRIDIAADVRTLTHPTTLPFYFSGDLGHSSSGAEFRRSDGKKGIGIGYEYIYAAGTDASHHIGLAAKGADGYILFSTGGAERMAINSSGFVGIGNPFPHALVQLSNTSANRKIVFYEATNNDHQFSGFGNSVGSMLYQVNATTSDHVFFAGTNASTSSELMRIKGDGNVGIGYNTPQNKVDIHEGAVRTGTHSTTSALYVTGALGDASNGLEVRHSDGTQGIGLGRNTIYAAGTATNQNMALSAKGTTGHLQFWTNGTEKLRITAGGQVGIGVTTPHAQLQLATSVANRKLILYEVGDNDHQYHGFGINGDGALRYQTSHVANDHIFFAATSATNSTELARIKGDGNVVISGVIETEAFITPTLLNNFTNYGADHATAAYYKDKMGRVFLRGLVNNVSNPSGVVIFTLPEGYRPSTSGKLIFTTISNNALGRIDISPNGNVVVNLGSAGWISMDNISFRAD